MFTFVLLSYNQEKLVLETLESIKHQVLTYGQAREFQLIISDDGSVDRTYAVEQFWLKQNAHLFCSAVLLPSDQNRGINGNFLRCFPHIKGEHYKTIAGDDLIADVNIAEICENTDIGMASFFMFNSSKIIDTRENYADHYLFFEEPYVKIKRVSKYIYPFCTQGWILNTQYNTAEMQDAISKYRLMEDRPQWRVLAKNDLDITFTNVPLVLYRQSDSSVTNKEKPSYIQHMQDVRNFYNNSIKESHNPVEKYILLLEKIRVDKNTFLKYLNPLKYYLTIQRQIRCRQINRYIDSLFCEHLDRNKKFLQEIANAANQLYGLFLASQAEKQDPVT